MPDLPGNQLTYALEAKHGKPVYFPFFQYRPGEIRAPQGYLAKFRGELLDLLPELAAVRSEADADIAVEVEEERAPRTRTVPQGKLTRIQDPELRSASQRGSPGGRARRVTSPSRLRTAGSR